MNAYLPLPNPTHEQAFPWRLELIPLMGLALLVTMSTGQADDSPTVAANRVAEWTFTAEDDTSVEGTTEVDVVVTSPSGDVQRVPSFWAGDRTWQARYASSEVGQHRYVTEVIRGADAGLDGVSGSVTVTPYTGDNPLYQHGPIRVAANRRFFEHADGTPFLWLADTWWMGLSRRLDWPNGFQLLAADRKGKGFSVIQIVGGLPPDMTPLDERGAGDGGQSWTADFSRIRPEFYNAADKRIEYLVDQGLAPCIVAAWKNYMPVLGPDKMKRHWRNLIARYGALPVVWCIGGEINQTRGNPKFMGNHPPEMELTEEEFRAAWTEVARYLHQTDPFGRIVGAHNQQNYHVLDDPSLLDMYFLQTGHSALSSISAQREWFDALSRAKHRAPLVMSEANYQWLFNEGSYGDQLQRHQFFSTMLDGGAGHTYGANGVWQVNQPEQPFGPSPHGFVWGNTPWPEAMSHAASKQIGLAKQWLQTLPWTELVPDSESVRFVDQDLPAIQTTEAQWVWTGDSKNGRHVIGTSFPIPADVPVRSATLRLACKAKYELSLNGQMVHRQAPLDFSDAHKHADAWEFPLAGEYLRTGRNVLLLRFDEENFVHGDRLLAHLHVEFADGQTISVASDQDWRWIRPSVGWPGEILKLDPADWDRVQIVGQDQPDPASLEFRKIATYGPRCASLPGRLRLIYTPASIPVEVSGLPASTFFTFEIFDPHTGRLGESRSIQSDAFGRWRWQPAAQGGDQVLVVKMGDNW